MDKTLFSRITREHVISFLLGATLLWFGFDYWTTRRTAQNGQRAFEFLVQQQAKLQAQGAANAEHK